MSPWTAGCWWCDGAGGGFYFIFRYSFGPSLPTNHCFNATIYQSIVTDHVHSFMGTIYHLLMVAWSNTLQSKSCLKLGSWAWLWGESNSVPSPVMSFASRRKLFGRSRQSLTIYLFADKSVQTMWHGTKSWCGFRAPSNVGNMLPKYCIFLQ